MFEGVEVMAQGIDLLLSQDLTGASDHDLLGLLRAVEVQVRRLAAVDHKLLGELDQRGVGAALGLKSTEALLQRELLLDPHVAKARAMAARDCAPLRHPDGSVLPPVFPVVAAAQAAGEISAAQGTVIRQTVISADAGDTAQAERDLVALAQSLPPIRLGREARQLIDRIDPDARANRAERQEAARTLSMREGADGMIELTGRLTPLCAIRLETTLSRFAAPKPATNGEQDPRTHGQRMHDALLTMAEVSQQAHKPGAKPADGPGTLLIVIEQDDRPTTDRGTPLTPEQLAQVADEAFVAQARIDSQGAMLNLGYKRRCASDIQTIALIARDRGCSFPDCTAHPAGATATTSSSGNTADPPTSTTSPCSAATTTGTTRSWAGPAAAPTESRNGSHPRPSTRARPRDGTPRTATSRDGNDPGHPSAQDRRPPRSRSRQRDQPEDQLLLAARFAVGQRNASPSRATVRRPTG